MSPSVSHFLGISIYIYTERGVPHRLPHFHAYYGEFVASFSIDPPALLEGTLPRRQLRYVLAWAEMRQDELRESWRQVEEGNSPMRISGLEG
jgi:hypothetical protein